MLLQQDYTVDPIFISILQIKKVKLRESKYSSQNHVDDM